MSSADYDGTAARREARRRKILSSSEDRMKKILGQGDADSPGITSASVAAYSATSTSQNVQSPNTQSRSSTPAPSEQKCENVTQPKVSSTQQQETSDAHREQPLDLTFIRFRHALCLIVGVLVRISFLYSFGEEYVQTMLNPFAALQIALVGYQKSTAMDLGMNVKGGLWLSALILSGVNKDIVRTYKNVIGVITAMVDDFTFFIFGFILTHLFV